MADTTLIQPGTKIFLSQKDPLRLQQCGSSSFIEDRSLNEKFTPPRNYDEAMDILDVLAKRYDVTYKNIRTDQKNFYVFEIT